MSNDNVEKKESYDIASINDALDELGMLSSVTQSRKDYLQENENLLGKLQHLNMNAEKAGPSQASEVEVPVQRSFFFNVESKSNENEKLSVLDSKEKENKAFESLHILTMNSQFITSFKTGYSFPLNELTDSPSRRVFRCNVMRKRKCRPHPYEKKTLVKVVEHCISTSNDTLSELDQTACRLRTTSLSSGTSSSRRVASERYKSTENNCGLQRSRSMENLTGSKENPPFSICDKTKDIETVSKGIQEMQMEDCT